MTQPAVVCTNISKSFSGQKILHGIDLTVESGEFLTILGPSGCGKTTVLRILAGLERQDTGDVQIIGKSMRDIDSGARPTHMVFQNYALFPHMSVAENIEFGLLCAGVSRERRRDRVEQVLSLVNMMDWAAHRPSQLSGGQQQRVAIARAVVTRPAVLLLDEPMSALDYNLRKQMRLDLKSLQRELGMTFVMVTHDQEEALSLSDRVVVMNGGRIEQIGTPRQIYEKPNNLFVTQFIGDANIFLASVLSCQNERMSVKMAGVTVTLNDHAEYCVGDAMYLVLRPEDMEAWALDEVPDSHVNRLPGTVMEVIYKGSTVDLIVQIDSGQLVAVTEFFDEANETLDYTRGESVILTWQVDWEVVLPHE